MFSVTPLTRGYRSYCATSDHVVESICIAPVPIAQNTGCPMRGKDISPSDQGLTVEEWQGLWLWL